MPKTEPAPDFDKEVLEPLRAAQAKLKADCDAQAGTLNGIVCELPPPPPAPIYVAPTYNYVQPYVASFTGLMGSLGYARAGGNCVNEPGVNNPGYGNPSSWPATSSQAWVGATALWYYDHVGVVTGIWSNGDLEIRHQNWSGSEHRFSRSNFRGFR